MVNLDELTTQDLEDISELQKFRKEAEYLYNAVIEHVRIPLYLDSEQRFKIKSRSDSNNSEYLALKDGNWVWQARYLYQTYDVPIDKDGIYRMFKDAYEFEKVNKGTCFTNSKKEAIGYF